MTTDDELAKEIKELVVKLNSLVAQASQRKINVQVEIDRLYSHDVMTRDAVSLTVLSVKLSKTLGL